MRDYLAFTYSRIDVHSDDARREGVALATDCLKQLSELNNPKRFSPRLLILLTSPEYLDTEQATQLLRGIHDTFVEADPESKEVPLIGCSVAAVFCDEAVYPRGALLIGLASHLIKVQVAVGKNARQNPEGAVKQLLSGLELSPVGRVDPNPLANRLLLTFLPGFKVKDGEEFYPAPQLHRRLREGVQARIGLVGGVCSAGNGKQVQEGLLYAGRQVFKDAAVAAVMTTGIPIGTGLSYGFEPTDTVLRVTEVAEDQRTVLAFDKYSPTQLFEEEGRRIFLVKLSTDGEPTIDLPLPTGDGKSLQLLRKVHQNDYFQVAKPNAERILEQFKEGFAQARERILIKKPTACLTMVCRAWYNCFRSDFDISKVLEFVEQEGIKCVGGFFDGEMGVDKTGRSLFMNATSSCLIFSDEMRERAPLYRVVEALAKFGPLLNDSDGVYDAALKIVHKTGFPGAMLSLVLRNRQDDYVVAHSARGERFQKIVELTRRPLSGNDILAVVVNQKEPRFIADSPRHPNCDQEAVTASGIISQYILPLKRLDGSVFGVLQVDLGDLRHYKTQREFAGTAKARTLDSLAEIYEAGLNRVINHKETDISLEFDRALNLSLSAASEPLGLQQFIEEAGRTLKVKMAHIRLATPKDTLAARDGTRGSDAQERVLTLVAGFGPCYEAGKKIRGVVSAKDDSLIYNAFSDDKVTIVNDTSEDKDYQALCRTAAGNAELTAALKQMKSYAAIAFKNEKGEPLGALSLASDTPWFFSDYLERAIKSLAQRVAFLIEHLRTRNRFEFLIKVSTKLAEIDLDEMHEVLSEALKQFSEAIKAEVGSLYLWNEDRERFILRAQYGWHNPEWVNAAHYTKDDNWIGVRALEKEPQYTADLNQYYLSNPGKPGGRYAQYAQDMFGQRLSDSYTVEAISLPLKIGKNQKKFGLLVVYRHIKPGEGSGFLSTDMKLLEEGAYKMAGLVNALAEHRNDVWRHQEQARLGAVYEAINSVEVGNDLEARTCKQVLDEYRAVEAIFYTADEPGSGRVSWIAGHRRRPASQRSEEMAEVEPDEWIKRAAARVLNETEKDKVAIQRRQLKASEHHHPRAVATEGLVERACIPLMSSQTFVGVLDLRWQITHRQAGRLEVRHSSIHLQQLGRMIGSVYVRHQLAKAAEQGKLAVQATGAYVFQRAHRLINAIQTLYRLAQAIKQAKTEDLRQAKIDELIAQATEYTETIKWTIDLGERVQNPARQKLLVSRLVEKSLDDLKRTTQLPVRIERAFPPDLTVLGSPELLNEIFVNLINNAVNAMDAQKAPTLRVSAAIWSNKKDVRIVVEDNGRGMTKEEIENAERGFVGNGSRKGVGVLISTVLAQVQGGSLEYESVKGRGAKAIVTLPMG